MPFDNKPETIVLTRLEKLQRLLWLAERATGAQNSWCTCLHHDALADPQMAGLPEKLYAPEDWERAGQWLGSGTKVGWKEAIEIFGFHHIKTKRSYLRDLIAREEKNRE